jgi:hypothetical protein
MSDVMRQYATPFWPILLVVIRVAFSLYLSHISPDSSAVNISSWCLRNVPYLPCEYWHNVEAWMGNVVFRVDFCHGCVEWTNASCIEKIMDFFDEVRMVSFSRFFLHITIIAKFLMCFSVMKFHHNECSFITCMISLYWDFTLSLKLIFILPVFTFGAILKEWVKLVNWEISVLDIEESPPLFLLYFFFPLTKNSFQGHWFPLGYNHSPGHTVCNVLFPAVSLTLLFWR